MSAPMDPEELAEVRNLVSATLSSKLARLLADRDHWEKQVQELLAVIHGDGGHHSERVGIAQSLADAHDALPTLRAELTERAAELAVMQELVRSQKVTIGLHVEVLAERTRERDESNRERDQARREVCEVTELGRHDKPTADAVAREYGWGYLYPKEGDQ